MEGDAAAVWTAADYRVWVREDERRKAALGRRVEDCLRTLFSAGSRRVLWSIEADDPPDRLPSALTYCRRQGMALCARLTVESGARSVGDAHPDWRCVSREGAADPDRMSLFFEGVRNACAWPLAEAARQGAAAVCLDFSARPPFVRYHPDMARLYVLTGGVDPGRLTMADEAYVDWRRYRAGFVTKLLRALHTALREVEEENGVRLPLMVRVPGDGLALNLAAGMDVRTWCLNRLADSLCVNPLRWLAADLEESIAPYVSLGAETGVTVLGGVSLSPVPGTSANPMVLMQRALRRYEQGAKGLVLDRAEAASLDLDIDWAMSALGDPERLARLAADPERQRQYPVTDANRWFGVDPRSCLPGSDRGAFPPGEL